MKKDAEHISVNTVRATFLLRKLMVLQAYYQRQPSQASRQTAVLNIFGNTGGRVAMAACRNFTFSWNSKPHFFAYAFS